MRPGGREKRGSGGRKGDLQEEKGGGISRAGGGNRREIRGKLTAGKEVCGSASGGETAENPPFGREMRRFFETQGLLDKIQSRLYCLRGRKRGRIPTNLSRGSGTMLAENIRKYRKDKNLSQDELAEKLGVSRQSISLWENGQTQPTIENIIALAKIFNVSTDAILGNAEQADVEIPWEAPLEAETKRKRWVIPVAVIAVVLLIGAVVLLVKLGRRGPEEDVFASQASDSPVSQGESSWEESSAEVSQEVSEAVSEPGSSSAEESAQSEASKEESSSAAVVQESEASSEGELSQVGADIDLFEYCKDFAIAKGVLNGDFCMYQQPATLYGGYDNEYFSISYWGDSNMVEFCLHCPLSETFSINFYLRMRGGYDGTYEYLSSRYYRDTGESLRSASGSIDPKVFSDSYPLNCDEYIGSFDGQSDFMEESRVGICDLIHCLKNFAEVEGMECGFSAFGFVNY